MDSFIHAICLFFILKIKKHFKVFLSHVRRRLIGSLIFVGYFPQKCPICLFLKCLYLLMYDMTPWVVCCSFGDMVCVCLDIYHVCVSISLSHDMTHSHMWHDSFTHEISLCLSVSISCMKWLNATDVVPLTDVVLLTDTSCLSGDLSCTCLYPLAFHLSIS